MICVSSINISASSITIKKGATYTPSVTVLPTNATNKTLRWTTNNSTIATVNSTSGKITGVAAGTTHIYAYATDGSYKSDYIKVTVTDVKVTSVALNKTSLTLEKGATYNLIATVLPSNANDKSLTWSSTNTSVATVSGGLVTAKAKGTATIKATSKDGTNKSASCSVTVIVKVSSVSLNKTSLTLEKGDTYNLVATVLPNDANDKSLTWSSTNTSVATVSDGVITAKGKGTATIKATSKDGSNKSASCSVTVIVKVSSVTLDKTSLTLEKGETHNLTATVLPSDANDKSLTWSSTNTSVATVSGGTVTAKEKGTATIIATSKDGSNKSASCTVTVKDVSVKSITVNSSTSSMKVGDSQILTATVGPENAANKNVVWSSSDPSVLSVNPETGLVVAISAGSAVISATAQDGSGVKGTYSFQINEPIPVESIGVEPYVNTLNRDETCQMTANVYPEYADDKSIKWSSSNPGIAEVDEDTGEVTCKSAGTVEIYATAQDGSGVQGSSTITVKQTVFCAAPQAYENKVPESKVADPIDAFSGAHIIQNTLMTLFGGQNLKLTAHYNSANIVLGSLGDGWYHDYEKAVVINDMEAHLYNSPASYSKYVATDETKTTYVCTGADKNGYVLSVDYTQEYPYILNCNSERTEYYNSNGDLAKVVTHQGFETLIDNQEYLITITDTVSGKKMYLEKDNEGKKLNRVYDDANREVSFRYDGNRLIEIYDLNNNVLRYTYDWDGRILTGEDSNCVRYFENTYDDFGRVVTQKDAFSNTTTFQYADLTRTTINRNGKQSTREFDYNGMLVSYTDENGNTKTYEYDEHLNVIKETDAKDNSIVRVYNGFNKPTEITDKNGNKTTITYDTVGNVTKITYPPINGVSAEETFVYNERNQITQHVSVRGTTTVYGYDENHKLSSKKIGAKNAILYVYENGLLMSQTDAMNNTTTYSYNTIGQLASKTDANNKATTYEYDAMGNLLKTTDANGKSIEITYDCNYQKTSVVDANGNRTQYSYDGNMRNTRIVLPDENIIVYEYDNEDRAVQRIDQNNNTFVINYDDAGRIISKVFPDNTSISYEYDTVGNLLKETNQKGAIIVRTYDAKGNILTSTDDDENVTEYQYNAMSKLVRVENAAGGVTTFEYSQAGDLIKETDPLGNEKTYTYDDYGNKLTFKDAKGNTTTYTYDDNNNLTSVKDALNNVTTFTYNCLNQLVVVKDAKNNEKRFAYDALGRCTTVTDARNNVFTTMYDANGNVIKVIDAKNNTVKETEYNCLNLPTKVTDATGKYITYSYNALGKVYQIVDSMNHTTTFSYNSRGQKTSVVDALDNESTATYDELGKITSLTGPLGATTTYTYDDMGKLTSKSTTSGGTVSYTYNELNVKEQITNARGQVRTLEYDLLGRITKSTSVEGEISYTYDANSNVLTVTDSNGTITREYDELNRVTKYIDTYGKEVCYQYDCVGDLVKLTYPDDTEVNYTYDANHNLVSVVDWANRTTTYTYDENNKLIGVVKPDGSVTTTTYDSKQRITSTVERTPQEVVITGFEYTYDDLDRLIEEKHLDNNTKMCYTYDSLSRVTKKTLLSEEDVVISEENFTYDAAGNITSDSSSATYSYGINNKLATYDGQDVEYDLDGNMLSVQIDDTTLNLQYDSSNKLVSAGGCTYTYNAENTRIRNLCEEEETTYTYNTNCRLSQLLQKTTNGVTTKYVYGRGLIGEETNSVFKTYHFDFRGSTIAITDLTGAITDTFKYDTYGKLIERTGTSAVIFGYNGRDGVVTDSNGLIYMRARYYAPSLKRFVNADIIAGEISNAITLNRYAYANANPVSFIDPLGLWSLKGAWNSFTNWVKKEIVDPVVTWVKKEIVDPVVTWVKKEIVDPVVTWVEEEIIVPVVTWTQKTIKNIETSFLKNESLYLHYDTVFDNYEHNVKNDIVDAMIDDQYRNDVGNLKIGNESMSNAGCEVIAVYNAKIMLGEKNVSLANTIEQFENNGALIAQPFASGYLGSNPYAIGRVLDAEGLKYSTIDSFEQMQSTPGVYIVSVWNSNKIDSMIHTVAIEVSQENGIIMKNGNLVMDSTSEDIFITGYKVSRK